MIKYWLNIIFDKGVVLSVKDKNGVDFFFGVRCRVGFDFLYGVLFGLRFEFFCDWIFFNEEDIWWKISIVRKIRFF